MLYEMASAQGFDKALGRLLQWYATFLEYVLGWADPWINKLIFYIGLDFEVGAHWKVIFVLMGLYLCRDLGFAMRYETKASAIFHGVVGAAVAGIVAMTVGALPASTQSYPMNLTIAVVPVIGLFIYSVAGRLYEWIAAPVDNLSNHAPRKAKEKIRYLFYRLQRAAGRTVVAILLAAVLLTLPWIQSFQMPGLAAFGFLIVLYAIYWLAEGLFDSLDMDPSAHSTWYSRFSRSAPAQIGMSMFNVMAIAMIFAVSNAGLGLLPLPEYWSTR